MTAPTMRPVLDHTPGNMAKSGGMIGDWSISFPDNTSLTAGQDACIAEAEKRGFGKKDIEWTKAAKDAGWAAFRARYNPRRKG